MNGVKISVVSVEEDGGFEYVFWVPMGPNSTSELSS